MSIQPPSERNLLGSARRQKMKADNPLTQAIASVPSRIVQRAKGSTQPLQSGDLLYLQRTIGNQALHQLLHKPSEPQVQKQSAMRVNAVGDRFEQEADDVAKEVISSHGEGAHERDTIQRSAETPQMGAEGGTVDRDLERRIHSAKGGGSPVPEAVQRHMAQITGGDFSGVRVHDNKDAHSLSSELGAKAATHGKDIFLARGQSPHDTRLMAHELTHTIQQGAVKAGNKVQRTVGVAKGVPAIQRETEKEKRKRKRKLKGKRTRAKVGSFALQALERLLTLPTTVLDQLSVTDLHLKDFGNFVRTGKTRQQRFEAKKSKLPAQEKTKHARGVLKRNFGRTGLQGYIRGQRSHELMYGGSLKPKALPWAGKLNPFSQIEGGIAGLNAKSKKYSSSIRKLRPSQEQVEPNVDPTLGVMDNQIEPEENLTMPNEFTDTTYSNPESEPLDDGGVTSPEELAPVLDALTEGTEEEPEMV